MIHVTTNRFSKRDEQTTVTDDMAIASEAIHGCSSKPSGENSPMNKHKSKVSTRWEVNNDCSSKPSGNNSPILCDMIQSFATHHKVAIDDIDAYMIFLDGHPIKCWPLAILYAKRVCTACRVFIIAAQLGNQVIFYQISLLILHVTVNSCTATHTI